MCMVFSVCVLIPMVSKLRKGSTGQNQSYTDDVKLSLWREIVALIPEPAGSCLCFPVPSQAALCYSHGLSTDDSLLFFSPGTRKRGQTQFYSRGLALVFQPLWGLLSCPSPIDLELWLFSCFCVVLQFFCVFQSHLLNDVSPILFISFVSEVKTCRLFEGQVKVVYEIIVPSCPQIKSFIFHVMKIYKTQFPLANIYTVYGKTSMNYWINKVYVSLPYIPSQTFLE